MATTKPVGFTPKTVKLLVKKGHSGWLKVIIGERKFIMREVEEFKDEAQDSNVDELFS